MMDGRYNTRSPAVKRLMREAQELSEPTDQYFAQPLDDNLFEWHFTVRGPADSDFQNGIYHGRIILPVDYPMKPPSIIWLTPNGRFETFKKICLSISGHHPESWQPSWSIRTALLAIIGFMPTRPGGAIGALDYTPEERKILAKKSRDWKCPTCGDVTGVLLERSDDSEQTSNEAKELAAQINLEGEKPKCKEGDCPIEQAKLAEQQAIAQSASAAVSTEATHSLIQNCQGAAISNNDAACNSTANAQQTSPSPSPVHPSIPFPQWSNINNPFPMSPFGYPIQFPGVPTFPPLSHFPYPPSHYTAMLQQNCHYPTSGSMQPPSFFPPPNAYMPSPESTANVSSNMNTQYSRTPMTSPCITRSSQPLAKSANEEVITPAQDGQKEQRGDVLKELLTKVKRVGSNPNAEKGSNATTDGQESTLNVEPSIKTLNRSEALGSRQKALTIPKKLVEEDTDSDMSKSLKKGGDASVSEKGDTNIDDMSDADAPPFDTEEKPISEKGASSSSPELETLKSKLGIVKGLRQRQSAMASVSTGVSEEGSVEPERAEQSGTGATRQQIESASGDTGLRNRSRHSSARTNNANNAANRVNARRPNQERSFDFSFYLMVALLAASMVILINRLTSMDWEFP